MQRKRKSRGHVRDCIFHTANFQPRSAIDDGLFKVGDNPLVSNAGIAAVGHVTSVFREKLCLTGAKVALWAFPKLREDWLPDDPDGKLIALFKQAYRRMSWDRAFRGVHSAVPYCFTGASPHQGHGFVYIPDHATTSAPEPESTKPPIVFLHGYGGNLLWNIWALKTEFPDHIILAPSGGIAWPDIGSHGILEYVDEMCVYVAQKFAIEIERPWLMALSQGGPTGFQITSHAPDRFRGFVSIASCASEPSELRFPPAFPILMIHGTEDIRISLWAAERTFEALKGRASIVLEKLEGANHFFFLSQREEMARLIREFWTKADTRLDDTVSKPLVKAGQPTMADCVGKYRWRAPDRRTIEFDLQRDGTFLAKQKPGKLIIEEGFGLVRKGKGTWRFNNGRLTIEMTHVRVLMLWKEHHVTWIDDEKVTGVTATEIWLAASNPLKRLPASDR